MKKDLSKYSKQLSFILRHHPEKYSIVLNKEGYAEVNSILSVLGITREELEYIVDTNDKKRFSFNTDKSKIRAAQGHTINVSIEMKKVLTPGVLYHGTKKHFLSSILKEGLKSMERLHVHLSKSKEVAINVANRRSGETIILLIDGNKMVKDGYELFESENGVVLTKSVPSKYISYEGEKEKKESI